MTPNDFELLGDLHKSYEGRWIDQLMPHLPFVVRLDGRAFHTFTKGFKRPYDERMSMAMVQTAKALVEEFHATVSFCQSDEITLGFRNDNPEQQIIFDGKVFKILSLFAAYASVVFNEEVNKSIPEKSGMRPIFDARIIQYPSLELTSGSFLWRETDATRNSLTMAAHAFYSHKELHGANAKKKHDLLHAKGINWNDYPTFFKRGTYVRRVTKERSLTDLELMYIPEKFRPDANSIFLRSSVEEIDMPVLESLSVSERIEKLFG